MGLRAEPVVTFKSTTKRIALVAVPSVLAMEMGPEVAPAGTTALTCVADSTVYVVGMPLKVTVETAAVL